MRLLRAFGGVMLLALGSAFLEPVPAQAEELRIAVPGLPATLDPQKAVTPVERALASELFMGLVQRDPNGQPVAGLAEKMDVSLDGYIYTFTLRDDLHWSDGTRLTAEDFVYSLKRALEVATAAPFADLLLPIQNADKFRLGMLGSDRAFGVSAPDRRTVRIVLETRSFNLLELLADPVAMPVPRHIISKVGAAWAQTPVGNGPYVAQTENGRIHLTRNRRFADADDIRIDDVTLVPVATTDDAIAAVRDGTADLTWGIPDMPAIQGADPALKADGGQDILFLTVNQTRGPFGKREVRHSLAMAVDRDLLATTLSLAGAVPAYNIVPPAAASYIRTQAPYSKFAMDARTIIATVLLTQEGYGAKKALEGTFAYPAGQFSEALAKAMTAGWEKVGVRLKLEPRPLAEHAKVLESGAYDVALAAWPVRGADPLPFLFPLSRAAGPWNTAHYDEGDFNRALADADRAFDGGSRMEYLRQAEELLIEDQIVIPLFFFTPQVPVSAAVRGWQPNARGVHPLRFLARR